MPRSPFGIGRDTLDRVRQRLEEEVGGRVKKIKERVKEELGLNEPKPVPAAQRPPARSPDAIKVMLREAVQSKPPRMVNARYKRKDAASGSWRMLQPYCMRYGRVQGDPGAGMLYAACAADGWKVEAFRLERFEEMQLTDLPYQVVLPYDIETDTF